MPKLTTKLEADYMDLINEKIYGLAGKQTGIPGSVEERKEALLSIVEPKGDHKVHEAGEEHINDLKDLLTEEGAALYGVKPEDFETFCSLLKSKVYKAIFELSNLTKDEAEEETREKEEIAERRETNTNRVRTLSPPSTTGSLTNHRFPFLFKALLTLPLMAISVIGGVVANNPPSPIWHFLSALALVGGGAGCFIVLVLLPMPDRIGRICDWLADRFNPASANNSRLITDDEESRLLTSSRPNYGPDHSEASSTNPHTSGTETTYGHPALSTNHLASVSVASTSNEDKENLNRESSTNPADEIPVDEDAEASQSGFLSRPA